MTTAVIISSDEFLHRELSAILRSHGHKVVTISNPAATQGFTDDERPAVALLDAASFQADAMALLERGSTPRPEYLVFTDHDDPYAGEYLRKGAFNVLFKPFLSDQLALWVEKAARVFHLRANEFEFTRPLRMECEGAAGENAQALQFCDDILEHFPDAMVSIEKGGLITLFNSAAESLLKHSKSDVEGKMNILQLYPPTVAQRIMRDLRADDFGGKGILKKREVDLLDRDGVRIPVYISAAILYKDGVETGSVGVFTDLRERKAFERRLLHAEKLSSLGEMSAGIAHEINQPLTGILTFAHLLRKRMGEDSAACKDLDVIIRETNRIKRIVRGVLDFARETPLRFTNVRVEDILDRTVELLSHQERFFGVTLTKEYDPNSPALQCDEQLMEQVFTNLIVNALDALRGAGALTIRTGGLGKWFEIQFADTGEGIPVAIQEKLFDPFFTTKSSSGGSGMGLGLAVSYGIVKNHQGEITVVSEPGAGAVFTVKLPLSAQRQTD